MALTATIKLSVQAKLTRTADFEAASSTIGHALSIALTEGTGAGQADVIWKDTRTLAASANESLDLAGSLTNIYGVTAAFARIKAVIVTAAAGNTNDVNVTRPANGVPMFLASGDGMPVRPGGGFAWIAPDATGVVVTASTGDLINFANSAGSTSVDYSVTIIGASA